MCIRYTGPPMSLTQTHGIRSYFRTHLSGSKGQSMGNLGIESTSHLKGSPFLNPTRCLNCWFFLRISDSPFQGTELFQVKRKLLNLRIITRSQPHYVQHDNLMEMPLKFKAPWIEWLFPFIFQSMNILGLGMNMFSLIMNGLGLSHNPETLPAFCSTPLFFLVGTIWATATAKNQCNGSSIRDIFFFELSWGLENDNTLFKKR